MSKAKWDGASLVIDTTREIQRHVDHHPRKSASSTTAGKEMKVETDDADAATASMKRNVVYTKS